MPACARKSAAVYFSLRWLLSRTATTLTPLLFASTSAFAIGDEVNEYACTSISLLAAPISLTTAAVAPPHGEKLLFHGGKIKINRGKWYWRNIQKINQLAYRKFHKRGLRMVANSVVVASGP